MKSYHYLFAALLLILTGIGLGVLFMLNQMNIQSIQQPTEIAVTEVKRSMEPIDIDGMIPDMAMFSIKDVAERVIPAVVYIETSIPVRRRNVPDDENHEFDENFWDRLLPRGRSNSIGSGVLISGDGFIMTNNHVIANSRDVRVTLHDKREFDATVVGRDPSTDLAVLKIDSEDLPHIVIGNSDNLSVGDWVMAVGNPLRLRSTITAGIVSALGRDVQIINDRMRIEHFIQTDAAINRGNSGGALVNIAGELVGINTAIATENGAYQGYGFAIPVNMAFKIASDLMRYGEVQRAFLGVQIVSVNQERARELGMPWIRGVEIVELVDEGAAQIAGLKRNDVVLVINDARVDESNQLQAQVAQFRPGDTINVKVWRDGEVVETGILLAGMENHAIQQWATRDPWEIETIPEDEDIPELNEGITIEIFEQGFAVVEYAKNEEQSKFDLIVSQILPESEADRAGLQKHDVIVSFNDVHLDNLESLKAGFENTPLQNERVLEVLREGELVQVVIEPRH